MPEIFVETWRTLINSETGVIFALVNDGAVAGVIGGVIYRDPNDGEKVASEFFWFVRPEFRGRWGMRLLDVFEDWARKQGAARISMVHLKTLHPAGLARFYTHRGYHEAETVFMKGL